MPLRLPRVTASRTTVVFVAALVAGVILRIVGLTWGLPHQLHPDEWVIPTGAVDMATRNSFEPSLFMRPDHVEMQLSFLAYSAYALLVAHAPVEVAYAADPGTFLLISRSITALLGVGMIVLAFLIGRRIAPAVGAIAAVLFAVFPPFVMHSHYATPDIPMTVAVMLLILACTHYLAKPGYASLLVASFATSAAIAIKYPGAISAVMIAAVVITAAVRERSYLRIVRHGLVAVVAVVGFLFLISPVLFTNVRAVLAAIRTESRTTHAGADGLGWGGNLVFYSGQFATAAGIILVALAIVGVVAAIRLRILATIPLAIGAVFWIVLSALPLHWERWGVPMYVTPLFFAAIGAYYGYRFARQRGLWGRWMPRLAVVASALVVATLTITSTAVDVRMLAPDTRLANDEALAELGVTPDNTIFEGYTPFLASAPQPIFDQFRYDDGTLVPTDSAAAFVMVSSCMSDRYFTAAKYVDERKFYAQLAEQFDVAVTFPAVPEVDHSIFGVVTAARSIASMVAFAGGGQAGCDFTVYSLR